MNENLHFLYCQKIILFRNNDSEVLLAKRQNEAVYDGVYTFVGGKMETTDRDIIGGLSREKNEEIGSSVKINICPSISYNVIFRKGDKGDTMVLPHHYAAYVSGDIILSEEEYSDYAWVSIKDLKDFEPKIANIPEAVSAILRLKSTMRPTDFIEI
jgi:NADH pyrophosphatase NudC (nudix superfamily)